MPVAEFYMKLLKHQGFMIHASAVEKEGKAYLFFGSERNREILRMRSFGGRRSKENRFGSLTMTSPQFVCKTAYFMHAGLRSAGKPIKMRIAKRRYKDFVCCIEEKQIKYRRLLRGKALPLILPQTLFYGDEEETNLLLSFLDRFLQSVPVYKMECTMEEEAAKTAYFCMKGEEK